MMSDQLQPISNTDISDRIISANIPPLRNWLVEVGPLACVIALLWVKLIYFSMSLRNAFWATKESVGPWIRTHPHIFSATLASLLLLFAVLPLLPRIWRFIVLVLLNVTLTSLILADTVHIRFYGDVISISSFAIARMLHRVSQSILKALRPTDALYYLDIVIMIVIFPFYTRACRRIPRIDRRHMARVCFGLLVSGLILAIPTGRLVWQDKSGLFAYTSLQREVCLVLGLLPYHICDAVLHLGSRGRVHRIEESERQRVQRFLYEQSQKRIIAPSLFGTGHGRNVILLSAESLQVFPIGLEINGQAVTPRFSEFAKQSLYFVNFYDQTHLGTTSDGEFTSLQSLHPLPMGSVLGEYSENHYHGLPAILSNHGYATLSACGASSDFWGMNTMHPRYGFQRSFYEETYKTTERVGPWLADKEFFSQTAPLLELQRQPFMAFLLSSSNHHPFQLPEKYRMLNLGELEGTLLGDYLNSVHYFDQAFGEFVDQLQQSGLLDKSILVVYGDHQAFLGETRELAELLALPEWNEYYHLLVQKRVPFIIRLPHGEGAGVKTVPGGHLDIAPTLLSLLGISDDSGMMLGRDLTRGENSLVVFRDGSFADGTHYFINRFGPVSNCTCYDVETGRMIDCGTLEVQRREARERLEISDLILRGDLVSTLSASGNKSPSR